MIGQRGADAGPVTRAIAENLPLAGAAFAGAMVVLSVHHWDDPEAGLAEVRRVTAGPIVILTFDPVVHDSQWLVAEYLPEMARLHRDVPSPRDIASMLGDGSTVSTVPIAHDCLDGFCHRGGAGPTPTSTPGCEQGSPGSPACHRRSWRRR